MADERNKSIPVSSLLGYNSLDENTWLNDHMKKHINEGFEDIEINYNPSLKEFVQADIDVTNSRFKSDISDYPSIESNITLPTSLFNEVNVKDEKFPDKFEQFKSNSNLENSLNDYGNDVILKNVSSKQNNGNSEEYFDKVPPVSFFSLFKYSSKIDQFLIFIACVIAFFSGTSAPFVMVLYVNIIGLLVDHHRLQKNLTSCHENNNCTVFTNEVFLSQVAESCLYMVVIGCVVFCFNYLFVSFFNMTSENQALKIRCMFIRSILRQDVAWFDINKTGDFASKLIGDLIRIQDGIGEKVGVCISFISTTIFCFSCASYYGWKLTLVCFSIVPLLFISMAIISKIQASVSGDELQIYGAASNVAEEVLSSIRTVASFSGEQKEIDRYENCLVSAYKKGIKRGFLTSIGVALTHVCVYGGYALGFWYGVNLIVEGKDKDNPEYEPGTLVIVFFNVIIGSTAIVKTAPYFEAFNIALGAAGKVFAIIEMKPVIDSSSQIGKMPSSLKGNITFKDVYFNFPVRPDVSILRGLSLNIKSGETVALVGPSGCGKSTIIQLMQRFYDAQKGSIEIDGHNIKDINVGWLRQHIGLVGQEPILFSTTIAENISYGKQWATLEEVVKAAKLANAHDFIEALPLKYYTLVGERGLQLSGGQKQRIAIARALIKNPKILLLDEVTSALDTKSEAIVQSALDQARGRCTTIIVAHRLSTIRTADKIVAMDNGIVKEIGTHEELMDKTGIYYQLVMAQTKKLVEDDEEDDAILGEDLPVFEGEGNISSNKSSNSDKNNYLRQSGYQTSLVENKNHKEEFLNDGKDDEIVDSSKIRLLKMFSPEWPYILYGSIAGIIMGLFVPIYAIVIGDILVIIADQNEQILSDITKYCLIFVAMAISSGIVCFLKIFMFSVAGEKLTARLRKMVFTNIIRQDMAWFDDPENSVSSLCSQLTSDASNVQGCTGFRISTILQALSTLVAAILIVFWINYKIGVAILCFIPLILFATVLENTFVSGHMLNEKSGTERASKVAIEAIENIRTVVSLHQEETFYAHFKSALNEPCKGTRKISQVRGVTFGIAQGIPIFAYAAALYYGSILVFAGEIKYSDLFKVTESAIFGTVMAGEVVAFVTDYQKAKVAAKCILKLLDLKSKIDAFSRTGITLDNVKGYIRFNNVCFNYPSRPKVKVLRGLNFEINPGQTIALVGSSGCGKSTCIQLIERFYDALSGDITLDNFSVKNMNVTNLRSHIGLVPQEPILFSFSLAENIAYGDNSRKVEMDEIIAAARQANIHEFIASLPQGYDTLAGDKGTQLSGGQKQRIAIARALLRNPKILLLDEATSALDAESELIVQEAFDKVRSDRTCLVIAHRLSTIQNADFICVIHQGKVVEKGTHQELLNLKGHYFNLNNAQAGIW